MAVSYSCSDFFAWKKLRRFISFKKHGDTLLLIGRCFRRLRKKYPGNCSRDYYSNGMFYFLGRWKAMSQELERLWKRFHLPTSIENKHIFNTIRNLKSTISLSLGIYHQCSKNWCIISANVYHVTAWIVSSSILSYRSSFESPMRIHSRGQLTTLSEFRPKQGMGC